MLEEPSAATIDDWGVKWACFICKKKRLAWLFGTTKDGRYTDSWNPYIRRRQRVAGYDEVKRHSWWNASCGRIRDIGKNFANTCISPETKKGCANIPLIRNWRRVFALKPMNCPCHVQIYKQSVKSYRDLPLRMAEFGSCHRAEPSGALHGLMRVRHFVQDDAHIFCAEEQIADETVKFFRLAAADIRRLRF